MRRAFAISTLILLSVVQAFAFMHRLEGHTEHCHQDELHLCPEEDHVNCHLCEEYLTAAITSDPLTVNSNNFQLLEFNDEFTRSGNASFSEWTSGRAPPMG